MASSALRLVSARAMTTCTFLLLPAFAAAQTTAAREITFNAGALRVYADVYETSRGKTAPVILLFHQGGGDARGEYREIIPRLLAEGYNALATDGRGGGSRFGVQNRAAATDSTFSYCYAVAEVEAAVNAARSEGFSGPLVLWGSSYSAILVMQAGARRAADVSAIFSFSPASGAAMAGASPSPYAGWLKHAGVPTLIIKPKEETLSESAIRQLAAFRARGLQVYVPEQAAHGSSALHPSRNDVNVEPRWSRA